MARNPTATLKDLLLTNPGAKSDDTLADTLRDSSKIVILTQAAYNALTPDANTIYITVG